MHCTTGSLLNSAFARAIVRSSNALPAFLAPSLSSPQSSSFSSTSRACYRLHKDNNAFRGVSALRHTGLGRQQNLRAKREDLPTPVLDPEKRSVVQVDRDHGLWEFFNSDRTPLETPRALSSHGRGWTVPELRQKDWHDLHRLWWVCVKERNRLETVEVERARIGQLYGEYEKEQRTNEIKTTMKAIKHTLTERWYAWENARVAAMEDSEVNLYADPEKGEPAYIYAKVGQEATPENEAGQSSSDALPPELPQSKPEARI